MVLNDKEKRMVVERIRTNQQGFGNTHFKSINLLKQLWIIELGYL